MTNDTTAPAPNTVAWFQIGTDDPAAAQEFYGGLFGWNVAEDPDLPGYDLVSYAGAGGPTGGIAHTDGGAANHATFFVLVTRAVRSPELVRDVLEAGHEIGLHGRDHRRLTTLDPDVVPALLSEARREL